MTSIKTGYQTDAKRETFTVYVLDVRGRIIDTSEDVAPLTGFNSDELAGKLMADYLDDNSKEALSRALSSLDSPQGTAFRARIRDCHGFEAPVNISIFPLLDEGNRKTGFVLHIERAY